MRFHKLIELFTFFAFLTCLPIQAIQTVEKDTLRNDTSKITRHDLNEIVVTAYQNNQPLRNISAPIQIIGKSKIDISYIGDISSVLNSVPGIQMQSGTFQTTKITIRGIGSRSPYSTNRTRAFVDDIPLTTGDGTTVIDDVELSFIDKIEITKGPYSAWYGSGMGGSLRFISLRESSKPLLIETNISFGSFGLLKYNGIVRISKPTGYLNVGVGRISGDGYRQNSSFFRNSVLISGQIKKQNKLNYLVIYSGVNAQTPSSIDIETFNNTPYSAAPNWMNVRGYKKYDRILGGIIVNSPIDSHVKNRVALSGSLHNEYELRPFNILDDMSLSATLLDNIVYSTSIFTLSAGVEWLHENYFWRILQNNTLLEMQKSKEVRNLFNTYISFDTKICPSMILSLSGNINSTHYAVTDLFPSDSIDYSGKYSNRYIFSPTIGLNYNYTSNLSLYTSLGKGFSNPTVEESLTSQGYLNTSLKPEQGWTLNMGARISTLANSLSMDVSVYYILLNDLLVTRRISEALFYGENGGKSTLSGIEMHATYKPASFFQTLISASKSENRFNDFASSNVNYRNNHLPGIPDTNINMDMQFLLFKRWQLNAIYTYTGSQFLNDDNTVKTNDFQTMNLRTAYTFHYHKKSLIQFIATINNVFDKKYASMVLINAPSFSGAAPRYYYPALPRNILFTLKIQLI